MARNSFGIADCEGAYSTLILLMLEQIHTLQEKCGALEAQIGASLQQFDTMLTTIPGISSGSATLGVASSFSNTTSTVYLVRMFSKVYRLAASTLSPSTCTSAVSSSAVMRRVWSLPRLTLIRPEGLMAPPRSASAVMVWRVVPEPCPRRRRTGP